MNELLFISCVHLLKSVITKKFHTKLYTDQHTIEYIIFCKNLK
jgi:hypothetical protein